MENECLSIVMPVYNEKDTLEATVNKVLELGIVKELIIVDDFSTDGSREIIKNMDLGRKIKKIFHEKNKGKGAALRSGFKEVTGEITAIQDADNEYDPSELKDLVGPIIKGAADVVYGSRLWGGKPQRVHMFWHLMGNRFLTLITNVLYNSTLTDMETCYKVMKTDIVKGMDLRSNDFAIEPEMTSKILKKKFRVYEMPISYYGRSYDEGKKITWKDGLGALWTLLKYRFID